MKREDVNYAISLLLLVAIVITGILGYIQAQFDLRKFIPHRYFAYLTLCFTVLHVYFNGGKLWRYFCRRVKEKVKK
ncbi:MAG: hypothetical protein V2A69_05775 [Pseudomonadota bacterium]